jgi:hypothetical protein
VIAEALKKLQLGQQYDDNDDDDDTERTATRKYLDNLKAK